MRPSPLNPTQPHEAPFLNLPPLVGGNEGGVAPQARRRGGRGEAVPSPLNPTPPHEAPPLNLPPLCGRDRGRGRAAGAPEGRTRGAVPLDAAPAPCYSAPRLRAHPRRRIPVPELPEVEAAKRYLAAAGLVGRRFTGADLRWPRAIRSGGVEDFVLGITGAAVHRLDRRGKFILIHLSLFSQGEKIEMRGPQITTNVQSKPAASTAGTPAHSSGPQSTAYLAIHLGMTGSVPIVAAAEPRHKFAHNVLHLDDGRELRFIDPRKLGGLWFAPDAETIVGRLGIEPLGRDFSPATLQSRLTGRSAPIKPLLMDQALIAGVGNIYADEALVRAGIGPLRPANSLTADEIAAIHAGLVESLQLAVDRLTSLGTSGKPPTSREETRDYFLIPREAGAPCRRCGAPVTRTIIRARSAYHCPTCQP